MRSTTGNIDRQVSQKQLFLKCIELKSSHTCLWIGRPKVQFLDSQSVRVADWSLSLKIRPGT